MDWQQVTSLGIVTLTAGLLGRNWITRRRHPEMSSCASHCASCVPPPAEQFPEKESRAQDSVAAHYRGLSEQAILIGMTDRKGVRRSGREE